MPAASRRGIPYLAALEGGVIGLILGVLDIHCTDSRELMSLAYFCVGLALGLRHAWRSWQAWQAWPPLGICLYVLHRVAIACGYKYPYVERSAESAMATFVVLFPSGLGIGLGAGIRLCIRALLRPGGSKALARAPGEDADPDRAKWGD